MQGSKALSIWHHGHGLTIRQGILYSTVLIDAEKLAGHTVLSDIPRVVILVVGQTHRQVFAFLRDRIAILQGCHQVVAILTLHLANVTNASHWIVTAPELDRVDHHSVCKVADYKGINLSSPYIFIGSTDEEKSLVCPIQLVPDNTVERDDGWKAFRIEGTLDFSLIGILAAISKVLADGGIGIFAISTFNTDYILTKSQNFERAIGLLQSAGYSIK